jgi:acyl-CoA thioesterase FadM
MGCLLFLNGVVQKEILASGATLPDNVLNLGASPVFTATMNVKFIKPVTTPQVVMATATLERIDGRKLFLNYTLRNGDGIEFARGEGVWMMTRNEKL